VTDIDLAALEAARKAVEDELIEWRDARRFIIGGNGFVVREKDGTESSIMRLSTAMGLRIGIKAYLAALATAAPRTEVVTWDWKEQPDPGQLTAAIGRVSAGTVHACFPGTGSDQYALVLSTLPLTPEAAARLYHDQEGS
jgi:hypothetical protein